MFNYLMSKIRNKPIWFHLPLWKTYRNEETKRIYLRYEFVVHHTWGSGGRNTDGSLKIYREGIAVDFDLSLTHGKVDYTLTNSEY